MDSDHQIQMEVILLEMIQIELPSKLGSWFKVIADSLELSAFRFLLAKRRSSEPPTVEILENQFDGLIDTKLEYATEVPVKFCGLVHLAEFEANNRNF